MSTKSAWMSGLLASCAALAIAQQPAPKLSSPIAPGASGSQGSGGKAASAATAATTSSGASASSSLGVPQGQGAGVHSPNSPFAPLTQRTDVLAWSMLTAITTKNEKNKILPVFGVQQLALHQKTQKLQGFMMPLEPGERQRHFLLTSGPESMVEVRTKTPVKYSLEPVVVEGVFQVLNDDPYGLYYRITDAVAVK
jgi:uncharacterized protein